MAFNLTATNEKETSLLNHPDKSSFTLSGALRGPLLSLRGSTVVQVGLRIWPDERAPEETDVRLYLELQGPDGATRSVEFGTSADGQTPTIEIFERVADGLPLNVLSDRKREWAKPQFWNSQANVIEELFLVSPEDDNALSTIVGTPLVRADLLCFADDADAVTGVRLEFSSGIEVWSCPGAYGYVVSTTNPKNWPSPVVPQPVWTTV